MWIDRLRPRRIERTGDDKPVASALRYALRMGGLHHLWLSLLAVCVAGLTLIPIELQRRMVNNAIEMEDVSALFWLGGIYLAAVVLQSSAKFFLRLYQGWLSESATLYTRNHLAEVRAKSQSEHDGTEGQTVAVISTEVDRLGGFVGEGISQPIADLSLLLAIVAYMLVVEPLVALLSLLFLLPQVLLVPFFQRLINRLIKHRLFLLRSLSDRVAKQEEEVWSGGAAVLKGPLAQIYRIRMRIFLTKFALKAANNSLSALTPLAVLMVGGYFVIEGETTLGVVVAFISGFERLGNPLRELMAYYRVAAQANVQHGMIARWM